MNESDGPTLIYSPGTQVVAQKDVLSGTHVLQQRTMI